jgi:hypothetical protein
MNEVTCATRQGLKAPSLGALGGTAEAVPSRETVTPKTVTPEEEQ